MNDIYIILLVILLGLIIFMIEFVLSRFSYKISNDILIMQWHILKYIPFGSRNIKLENIKEARRFKLKDDLGGGDIFGNVFTKRIVIIILKKGRFFRKMFITPDESDFFIEQINKAISSLGTKR